MCLFLPIIRHKNLIPAHKIGSNVVHDRELVASKGRHRGDFLIRLMCMKKKITVAVSGGFDPVHKGHIRQFKAAKKLGYELIVILNSDDFLLKKKGYYFMNFDERKEILESIKYVDRVVKCIDKDQTVSKTLKKLKPSIFANGGDRTNKNVPEIDTCKKNNIKMIWNVGGVKIQSSSDLVRKQKEQ